MLAPLIRGRVVFFPGREKGDENKKKYLWDDHGVHTTTQQAAQCDIFFYYLNSNLKLYKNKTFYDKPQQEERKTTIK